MQEPNTPEEIFALHRLRRADPQQFLEIVNEWLQENPRNSRAYFKRHYVWSQLGEPQQALNDLDKVIGLNPTQAAFFARGMVHRQLGDHENALADFHRGEMLDKKEWQDHEIPLFFQADSYAQVGTKLMRSIVARAYRTASGRRDSGVPPAARRPRSPKSCAAAAEARRKRE